MRRTPPADDDINYKLYARVVTAIVGTLLKYLPDKAEEDRKLLAQFNRVKPILFSDNDPINFYLGKAKEMACKEIADALPQTTEHPKPRTKHLFRMDTDDYDPYDPTRNTEL